MKRRLLLILLTVSVLLFGCGKDSENEKLSLQEQTISQLGIEENDTGEKYVPLNYSPQKAVWITMEDMRKAVTGTDREGFTCNMTGIFEKIKDMGANTVYLHVKAYNDAYYHSKLSSPASGVTDEYDPLTEALKAAHGMELSVHAWINPLRCMTDEQMQKLDEKYAIKKWYEEDGDKICHVGDRWYLSPAYNEVREFIGDEVTEILEKYDIDGIHIDDYFYPTKDEDFDEKAFSDSGAKELDSWRRDNIDLMVKEIYDRVKESDERILFGISPQGNLSIDENELYADVRKWCSEKGYCDYIVPQIYYGFKNENMPFEDTFHEWESMIENGVELTAGICTYKIGNVDKWAGTGSREWIEDSCIPSRECSLVLKEGAGAAVYSVESLLSESNAEEYENIKKEFLKIKSERR